MAKKSAKSGDIKVMPRIEGSVARGKLEKELKDYKEALASEISARRKAESRGEEIRRLYSTECAVRTKALNDLALARGDIERRDDTNKRVLNAGQQLADRIVVLDDVILNLRNQNADMVRALVKLALKIV